MDDIKIKAPPQPGSPQQAQHWLPLGPLGIAALIGAIFCVLLTLGFAWLAKGVFADRFVAIDNGVITWLHGYWGAATDNFMLFFTTIGEVWVLGPLIAIVAYALVGNRGSLRVLEKLGLRRVGELMLPDTSEPAVKLARAK